MKGKLIFRCRLWIITAVMAIVLALTPAPARSDSTSNTVPTRTIGIEGRVVVDLPRDDYRPRPLDDRTEFILRINSITAAGNGNFRYELYYMGLEPEHFELADYLIRPDGSRPDELAGTTVTVRSLLPEDHDGRLAQYTPARFPFIGGYRYALGAVGLLWAGGIAGFIWSYRKRHPPVEVAPAIQPPSFAERLRPLVEAAARGQLTVEQKAQIERLLLGYWREKLQLPESRMAEAVAQLRNHAQAGALLRALERWLHQRGGATAAEINDLLQPYRHESNPDAGGAA